MALIDKKYHEILEKIIQEGYWYDDPYRKGVKRKEITSYEFNYPLQSGFPAVTTKKLYWKGVITEVIWFLKGDTNIKYLVQNDVNIWNKDAYNYYLKKCKQKKEEQTLSFESFIDVIKNNKVKTFASLEPYVLGDLGKVYGGQWRDWENFIGNNGNALFFDNKDQLKEVVKNLMERPLATDHIVTAWNPSDNKNVALPPCHYGFQILVQPLTLEQRKSYYRKLHQGKEIKEFIDLSTFDDDYFDEIGLPKYGMSLKWNQRSVDVFLGLPFNIASYGLITHILCKMTNMLPIKLIGNLSKVHIYNNQIDAVKEQLSRDTNKYKDIEVHIGLPRLHFFEKTNNVDDIIPYLRIEDFILKNYKSYPPLRVEMLARDKEL